MADPFLLNALRFLELGDNLRAQNRLAEARAAYESVLSGDPANASAWMGLALAAEGLGDHRTARDAFANTVQAVPGEAEAWLGLASARWALGENFAAIEAWLAAWRLKSGDLRIHNVLWQALNEVTGTGGGYAGLVARGNGFRADGQVKAALAAYREAQAMDSALPFAYSRAGCLLAKHGDYKSAETEFAKARALAGWVESGIRLEPAFFETLPKYRHPFDVTHLAGGTGPLAVVGCDGIYFKRYGEILWQSLCRFEGERAGLHVHLVNPDPDCLALARSLKLGISIENPDLSGRARNFVNTYYASARFLALPELLASYQRPLLVMDVDAQLLKPLTPLWDALAGQDMALRRLKGTMVDPWNEPQANLVGVNSTALGETFARRLARFLAHFANQGRLFGFFDQTALYSVLAADPALSDLRRGSFPDFAYGYPHNRGADPKALSYPSDLIVGEVKTP